jgi:hypothetical protein
LVCISGAYVYKIQVGFYLGTSLALFKAKNLGVANTLSGGDNQFTRSKKIAKEIRENNGSK